MIPGDWGPVLATGPLRGHTSSVSIGSGCTNRARQAHTAASRPRRRPDAGTDWLGAPLSVAGFELQVLVDKKISQSPGAGSGALFGLLAANVQQSNASILD